MDALARAFFFLVVGVVVLVAALFALRQFFDPVLGEGVTAVLSLILTGAAISAVLIFVGQGLNNATHRSAGEDITEFAKSWSRTQTERARIEREYARAEREQIVADAKIRVMEERSAHQLAQRMARSLAAAEVERQNAQREGDFWEMRQPEDARQDADAEWRFHE